MHSCEDAIGLGNAAWSSPSACKCTASPGTPGPGRAASSSSTACEDAPFVSIAKLSSLSRLSALSALGFGALSSAARASRAAAACAAVVSCMSSAGWATGWTCGSSVSASGSPCNVHRERTPLSAAIQVHRVLSSSALRSQVVGTACSPSRGLDIWKQWSCFLCEHVAIFAPSSGIAFCEAKGTSVPG